MRTAIVLLNLGAPDNLDAVEPFLFNLFNDPAIIRLPWPLRPLLAKLVARKRAPIAKKIYEELGGGSPLLANTKEQAIALERELGPDFKTFISMRYWRPRADEVAKDIQSYAPDRLLLVPLYPQYSSTTTLSSLRDLNIAAARHFKFSTPLHMLCCYPDADFFINTQADLIRPHLKPDSRILFSAHGLPEKIINGGDPYQWQCEQTAKALAAKLGNVEWLNTYQSRVGPLKWIGPSTESEIERAGAEKRPLVIVPIAFVSEHSETLVELDIEYKHLAEKSGVPHYARIPTVSTQPAFIKGLADQIRTTLDQTRPICSHKGARICPASFKDCPHARSVSVA